MRPFSLSMAPLALVLTLASCNRADESAASQKEAPEGMLWIPGGEFAMGSTEGQPNETPVHTVRVKGFWMDETEVTNAQFREFVEATGYVTQGEKSFSAEDYPNAPPEALLAGSLLFKMTDQGVHGENRTTRPISGPERSGQKSCWIDPEPPASSL